MSIIRKRNGSFTVVNNSIFSDERLSMEAVGVLCWLLSKPDNWHVVQSHIAGVFKVGKDKTYRVIRELIDCGYLTRRIDRNEIGEFGGITYVLYDNPPLPENPHADKPNAAKPLLVKTNINNHLEVEEPVPSKEKKENQAFDQFWHQYPDKTGKAYSQKVFSKLSQKDQDAAANSVPAFVLWVQEKRKTFKDYSPPNPSTYLNQRRFEDYSPPEMDWGLNLEKARRVKSWVKDWGPLPHENGCKVPANMLLPKDGADWKIIGARV